MINLSELLQNIQKYTDIKTENDKGFTLTRKDIIVSNYAVLLPVANGKTCEFDVNLYNYQSTSSNPSVMTIVVSSQGTSIQFPTSTYSYGRGSNLQFNLNGHSHSFIASRLADVRESTKSKNTGDMSIDEQSKNFLYLIQVPLVNRNKEHSQVILQSAKLIKQGLSMLESRGCGDIDHAQISVSDDSKGNFPSLKHYDYKFEIDDRYPIRCDVINYLCTDSDKLHSEQVKDIFNNMKKVYSKLKDVSSLVVSNTSRKTETINYVPTATQDTNTSFVSAFY
jgi:hypothetical protein